MVMEDIIEFVEKAGFEVSNKEDYKKLEIRDLKTNELLKRYLTDSPQFYGEFRYITLNVNYVEIILGNGVRLTKQNSLETYPKNRSEYEINYVDNNDVRVRIVIECDYADEKSAGNLTIKINNKSFSDNNQIFCIKQNPFKTEFFNGNNDWILNIENCKSDLYLEFIMKFLNKNNFVLDYPSIQEAIKIVMPFVLKNIEKLISSRVEHVENYIQDLEQEKEVYQEKIDKIDADIGRLRKVLQSKPMVKK